MTGELIMHDYIITLIEAAKKATKKLKRKKIKKILESEGGGGGGENEGGRGGSEKENKVSSTLFSAFANYLGEKGMLKAIVRRVGELVGTHHTNELYELLNQIAQDADKTVKPENLYLLKPALDAMRDFLRKCEKLEKGEQLEGSNVPSQDQCKALKDVFKQFIEKYEITKKGTPFYKRWYYWFMSQPMWKRLLIGFILLVVLFIILFVVFKVGPKVAGALKRALNGDKTVGKKLVVAANNASSSVKTAAFGAVVSGARKAALYL